MKHLIEGLHKDHRNLSRLLTILEASLLDMQSDNDPNYPLMIDIVEYIDAYPEVFHHPREDILYRTAIERDPSIKDEIELVLQQHVYLTGSTHLLRDSLNAILSDAVLDKVALEAQLQDFIDAQRKHIILEEREIFPHIEKLLTSDDIKWLDEQHPPAEDPLFGEKVEERFRQLYEQILALS